MQELYSTEPAGIAAKIGIIVQIFKKTRLFALKWIKKMKQWGLTPMFHFITPSLHNPDVSWVVVFCTVGIFL